MTAPTSRELFPALASTMNRSCYLRDGVTSSFVVPGDWVPTAEADVRVEGYGAHSTMLGEASDVAHNDVEFFVDGPEAYAAIWEDLQGAMEAGAAGLVGQIGWTCYQTTPFAPGIDYVAVMQALVRHGVKTRVVLWASDRLGAIGDHGIAADKAALEASAAMINALHPAGVATAYLDAQTKPQGSHHQKIWIILGRRGLSAYFGGLDINTNRVRAGADFKDPWHDVHGRVRGPAAERFLGIFFWRLMGAVAWSPDPVPAPDAPPPAAPSVFSELARPSSLPTLAELHAHRVSVHEAYGVWQAYKDGAPPAHRIHSGPNPVRMKAGSTVGNPQLVEAGFPSEIGDMVTRGIGHSRRFVYVEDQYFWHLGMAQTLGRRVSENAIKQIIIVTNVVEGLAEHPPRTRLGLWHLARAARGHTDRILVFERVGSHGRYLHSKIFIYDDVSAHVGSANFNNRGYTHDSETAGVWVDRVLGPCPWHSVETTLARKLRAKLWAKHLGIPTANLFDGLGASAYWNQLATRPGPETAPLVAGGGLPTVHGVTLDGLRWPDWARAQAEQEPPGELYRRSGWVEGAEWIVDPE